MVLRNSLELEVNMKHQYRELPQSMNNIRTYGFSWKEFVISIPSPLFLVTSYKANGQPNACMQSWATFTSANGGHGFYAILRFKMGLFPVAAIAASFAFVIFSSSMTRGSNSPLYKE